MARLEMKAWVKAWSLMPRGRLLGHCDCCVAQPNGRYLCDLEQCHGYWNGAREQREDFDVAHHLHEFGYEFRVPEHKGQEAFDVIAWNETRLYIIIVKTDADGTFPALTDEEKTRLKTWGKKLDRDSLRPETMFPIPRHKFVHLVAYYSPSQERVTVRYVKRGGVCDLVVR